MKILFAKFFQAVQLPTGSRALETKLSATADQHNMTLQDNFIVIQHVTGGDRVYVTVNNLCFMRVEHEPNPSPAPSSKSAPKAKTKAD